MSTNDLRVIVVGRPGSGKSTIAAIIERALASEGLLVIPDTTNPDAPMGSHAFTSRYQRAMEAIVPLMDRDMAINIHEVQANRSGTFDPRTISQTFRPGR